MAQRADGSEWLDLTKPRPVYEDKRDLSTLAEAEVRQKLAKNRNWLVCKSWLDEENKRFAYECALNANETVLRTIDFKEACEDFHWKKFDILNHGQTIKWYHDPAWDEEVAAIEKRVAKASKKAAAEPEDEKPASEWRN